MRDNGKGTSTMKVSGRQLKVFIDDKGYPRTGLSRAGKSKLVLVHRLILLAFVGPCPPGMEGCHEDGDPLNCTLANLRWDTPKANKADSIRHGTSHAHLAIVNRAKTECPWGHLLIEVNLVKSRLPHRICLACNRADSHIRNLKTRGRPYLQIDRRDLADLKYAKITARV